MNPSLEVIFSIACLLISLIVYFQSGSEFYLKLFPVYFLFTDIILAIGTYLANRKINNAWLLNGFSLAEFVFYFYVLREIIKNHKVKRIILNVIWIYPVIALLNMFFFQKHAQFHSLSYALGCLLVASMCVFYYYELFQFPSSTRLSREPAFWICTAIFFSNCCNFPLFSLIIFFNNPPRFIISNIVIIITIINIFTYSLFIIAFLCRIRTNKSMLSS